MANAPVPSGQPLDRQALERVIARAAELQARAGDPFEATSEAELMALGKDVGLSPEHMKLALAEERTRALAPQDGGLAYRLLGAATVSATRTVPGSPAEVLGKLDGWFAREESLTVQRRSPTRVVWEPRRDFFGSMQRAFQLGGRGYALGRAGEVSATAEAVGDGRTLVRLDANLVNVRNQMLGGAAGVVGTGVVTTGIFAAIGVLLPFAVIPAAITPIVAVLVARSFKPPVARAGVMLDHYLDRLEHGDPKAAPSLLDLLPRPRLNP